jgi:predicted dehydrogenase
MTKQINVGVVGCGYWGPNLVRNFRSLQNCTLKVICDISEERLAHLHSLYPEVERETNFDRLLQNPALDAIVVAPSVRHHFRMAKKPMASSAAECEELIEIARQRGLILMVGHTFLYSAAVRKIKDIIDHHDIGDIRYISARRLNLGLFQKEINVTWDLAPHDISIILYIMQESPHSIRLFTTTLFFRKRSKSSTCGWIGRRITTPSLSSITPITMGICTVPISRRTNRSTANASIFSTAFATGRSR